MKTDALEVYIRAEKQIRLTAKKKTKMLLPETLPV